MSRKHRWKLDGVERSDFPGGEKKCRRCLRRMLLSHPCVLCVAFRANSVTWNPHKMMSVPLQCSALLVREEVLRPRRTPSAFPLTLASVLNGSGSLSPPQGLMQNCNQMHACYLFQQDKHYDLSYDTGDKALQCGRHVDIFKLWLMWQAKVRPLR